MDAPRRPHPTAAATRGGTHRLLALLRSSCLLLGVGTSDVRADGDTPLTIRGVTVLNAEQTAALSTTGARVIDTRALHDFLAGHLPEAAHVDYKEHSARSAEFDPRDDEVPAFLARLKKFASPHESVIFYCNGLSCWKSFKAALAASTSGYRYTFWFRGGLSEWKQSGRPVVQE